MKNEGMENEWLKNEGVNNEGKKCWTVINKKNVKDQTKMLMIIN